MSKSRLLLAILTLSLLIPCLALSQDKKPSPPYSDLVRTENLLFLSGKLGYMPGTRDLAPGGIKGETRQALENIKAILEKEGSSLSKVVKCTVFLADIKEWAAMNEVYRTYFTSNPPARSAVGVGLGGNARIEIECIATAD